MDSWYKYSRHPPPFYSHSSTSIQCNRDGCMQRRNGRNNKQIVCCERGGRRSAGGPGGNDDDRRWQPSRAERRSTQCGRSTPQGQGAGAETEESRRYRIASSAPPGPLRSILWRWRWWSRRVKCEKCLGGLRASCRARRRPRGLCLRAGRPHTSPRSRSRPRAGPPPSCSIRSGCLQLAEARQTT